MLDTLQQSGIAALKRSVAARRTSCKNCRAALCFTAEYFLSMHLVRRKLKPQFWTAKYRIEYNIVVADDQITVQID